MSVEVKGENDLQQNQGNHNASSRWRSLDILRETHLATMRMCSALTLPYLLPPKYHTEDQVLPTPFQAAGAQAVNNLSSKLNMTLFSPNQPFFKLEIPKATIEDMEANGDSQIEGQIKKALSEQESIIQNDMERNGFRVPLGMCIKYAVVTGNALLYQPLKGEPSVYRLDQYVVRRDQRGRVLEIILKQLVPRESLDETTRAYVNQTPSDTKGSGEHTVQLANKANDSKNFIPVYTVIKKSGQVYKEHQELEDGYRVQGSEGSSPVDAPAYLAIRWTGIPNEDYGRSLVEEYLGDFRSLEMMYRAMIKGTACMSKVIYLVNPAGMTNVKALGKANTGDFVVGSPEDVHSLQTDKANDFSLAINMRDNLEQRIAKAFLVTSSLQRDAERVTAEEIRLLATEIEDALGGVYSILAEELQEPVLRRQMHKLQKNGSIKKVNNTQVEPKVVAGIDGLGRGQTLKKIETLANMIQAFPTLSEELDTTGILVAVMNAIGLDPDGLTKTQEQKQQAQQAQQQQQMQQSMMDGASKSMPTVAKGAIENPEAAQEMMQQMQEQMQQQQ